MFEGIGLGHLAEGTKTNIVLAAAFAPCLIFMCVLFADTKHAKSIKQ